MEKGIGPQSLSGIATMVIRSFLPPIILIGLVLESILGGLATPTEAAGVGALGAIVLGFINLVLLPSLSGDELVNGTVDALGLGSRLSCCSLLDLFWWRHSLKFLSGFRECC